ncbi:hypothetical protein C0J52_04117, partial [Blattella germanica]
KEQRETGSVLNKKPERKHRVLTDERLNDIGTRLQVSPRKSLSCLAALCGILRSTVHIATKLLKLKPYKIKVSDNVSIRVSRC